MAVRQGLYAEDGSLRVTSTDGVATSGVYAPDGSFYVTIVASE